MLSLGLLMQTQKYQCVVPSEDYLTSADARISRCCFHLALVTLLLLVNTSSTRNRAEEEQDLSFFLCLWRSCCQERHLRLKSEQRNSKFFRSSCACDAVIVSEDMFNISISRNTRLTVNRLMVNHRRIILPHENTIKYHPTPYWNGL